MKMARCINRTLLATASALILSGGVSGIASATAPCGDFGECKALIEINATDGDIGFHFLKDGDDLLESYVEDPDGQKVFEDKAKGPLVEQKLTETFVESAEPLCWDDPDADPDEEIVTIEEFVERWTPGTYGFFGKGEGGDRLEGQTELTFEFPAAPMSLNYDDDTGEVSWQAGTDLGQCASEGELYMLVDDGVLPVHPQDVPIIQWEVVVEVEGNSTRSFVVELESGVTSVVVPSDFLDQFGDDTPGKIEVGAIAADDNATFAEDDICINEDEGCEDD